MRTFEGGNDIFQECNTLLETKKKSDGLRCNINYLMAVYAAQELLVLEWMLRIQLTINVRSDEVLSKIVVKIIFVNFIVENFIVEITGTHNAKRRRDNLSTDRTY